MANVFCKYRLERIIGLNVILILVEIVQHTSASLMINENADPDVRTDMEMSLNKIAPENFPYIHTDEGSDDMVRKKKGLFKRSKEG
jgi:thiamine phosphate synthase YjbQ (UPF0047 family)